MLLLTNRRKNKGNSNQSLKRNLSERSINLILPEQVDSVCNLSTFTKETEIGTSQTKRETSSERDEQRKH